MRTRHMITGTLAAMWLATGAVFANPTGELTVVVANFGREILDIAQTTTQDLQYTSHVFDPLISGNDKGELSTDRGLAESWAVTPDAKTVRIKLRRGVTWHDGKPFTTDDVIFTLGERLIAPDANCTLCRSLRASLAGIRAFS